VCDKHGSLIDLEVTPANHDDRASAVPMLPRLAELGFQGDLLADNGYKGEPFATAVRAHDMEVSVSPGGTSDGQFIPNGVRWVVEIVFTQLTKADVLAFGAGRQHVTDLNVGIGDDHAVDEQQHELPALLKGGFGKSVLDARAEGLQ